MHTADGTTSLTKRLRTCYNPPATEVDTRKKNLFVKGRPGSGKTTLIIRVVGSLKGKEAGGFYTREVRDKGERTGFSVHTLDGGEGMLSHVNFKTGPRVGKYVVNLEVIDTLIMDSVEHAVLAKDIVVIDEIGKMEMFSGRFTSAVKKALDSQKQVLATIPVYTNDFLRSISSRTDVEVFNLDVDNRDYLADIILRRIGSFLVLLLTVGSVLKGVFI